MRLRIHARSSLIGAALLLLLAVCAGANTLHVPHKYPTIQAAIDAAAPGDTVLLAEGAYTGVGNHDLDFGGKAITLRSVGDNPRGCILDCQQMGRGFVFHSGETASSVVRGITIQNGSARVDVYGYAFGGGMYISGANPTVIHCTFLNNTASTGGGLYNKVTSGGNTLTLTHCIFLNNTANAGGGFFNETFSSGNNTLTLTNSIFWGNTAFNDPQFSSPSATVTFSDIQMPTGVYPGIGNLNADPLFVEAPGVDLHLTEGSPCINVGNNAVVTSPPFLTNHLGIIVDLNGKKRIRGGTVDLGAYEFRCHDDDD